jgi:hypothetical protein
MAIYRILQNCPFGPDEIARLVAAYEETLSALGLKDRSDPITELVARKIIEISQTGVRDPQLLAKLAIKDLGAPSDERAPPTSYSNIKQPAGKASRSRGE